MIKVIGVRFRSAGKIYFFDPLQFDIKKGDNVIVETARGIEYGTVVSDPREVEDEKVVQPLKPVIRIASQRDQEQEAANKTKEKEAYKICMEKIRQHGLDMKLIDAEYTFDNNKVLFYFTADGRIDFRELVKDLASVFKTRIELRQIGVRDETKIMGGIGICGRPLCCHSYLSDFIPVSIKMAKEQNLSLNPAKISGVCGRLMCCLKNEEETYEELNRRLPNIGDMVTTEEGFRGEVHSVNVLRQLVKVVVETNDEKEIREYQAKELHFKRKHTRKERMELSAEELEELERLEKEEFQESKEHVDSLEDGGADSTESNRFRQGNHYNRRNRNDRPDNGDRRDRRDNRSENNRSANNRSENVENHGSRFSDRQNNYSRRNRPENTENRNSRGDRSENAERSNRGDRSENTENRSSRGDRSENAERSSRGDRSENAERGNRGDRSENAERSSRGDRSENAERGNRGDRSELTESRDNRGNRSDRPDRQGRNRNRNRKPDRQNRQEGNPKGNDSDSKG